MKPCDILCAFNTGQQTRDIPLHGWWGIWLLIIVTIPCAAIVIVVVYCSCHSAAHPHPAPFSNILTIEGQEEQQDRQQLASPDELDQPIDVQQRYRPTHNTNEENDAQGVISHTVIPVNKVAIEPSSTDHHDNTQNHMQVSDIENQ